MIPGIPIWLYAIAAGVIFSAGAWSGHSVTSNAWKAEQAEVIAQAIDDYKAEAAKANAASVNLEERKDEIRTVTQTVTKIVDRIVDRPVYRNVCLDPDGVQLVNSALAGTPPATGGPDAGVPRARAP